MPLVFILSQVAGVGDLYEDPLLQDRTDLHTRPGDTWKVKLTKCGGFCAETSGKCFPPNQTFLPPPCHRAVEGLKVLEKEEPGSVTPNILSQPPQFCPDPPGVWTAKGNTGSPRGNGTFFRSKLGQPNSPLWPCSFY